MTPKISLFERDVQFAGSGLLLALVAFAIFGVPLFGTGRHEFLYSASFTAIFVLSALAIDGPRKSILGLAIGATLAESVTYYLGLTRLHELARLGIVIFFAVVVVALILQVARTRRVDARVIMAAVTGYLLLGLLFCVVVGFMLKFDPVAINLPQNELGGATPIGFSDVVYYGFVTFTTVGYGDAVPLKPYSKALATLIGVAGQLYVAIIIALLVGKFSSTSH